GAVTQDETRNACRFRQASITDETDIDALPLFYVQNKRKSKKGFSVPPRQMAIGGTQLFPPSQNGNNWLGQQTCPLVPTGWDNEPVVPLSRCWGSVSGGVFPGV